jgi:hypothetical protein
LQGDVFLADMPLPGVHLEARAEFLGHHPGSVGGAGIDNDDFLGEFARTGQATRQIFLLIEGDDGDRERKPVTHAPLILNSSGGGEGISTERSGSRLSRSAGRSLARGVGLR